MIPRIVSHLSTNFLKLLNLRICSLEVYSQHTGGNRRWCHLPPYRCRLAHLVLPTPEPLHAHSDHRGCMLCHWSAYSTSLCKEPALGQRPDCHEHVHYLIALWIYRHGKYIYLLFE